ncbi:hypothetical protein OH76DRAFT_1299568, partial [Lentinus brumalis]
LHPAYKQDHFRRAKWEPEWIAVAEDLLREEWEKYYKPKTTPKKSTAGPPADSGRRSAQASTAAMFDAIAPTSAASTSDPLEVYLASPPNPAVSDPLAHWNALLGSKSDAPLARFALDYLSVPGESS